jgi:hypothetical protein
VRDPLEGGIKRHGSRPQHPKRHRDHRVITLERDIAGDHERAITPVFHVGDRGAEPHIETGGEPVDQRPIATGGHEVSP